MSLKTIKKTIYFFKTVPKCTLFADGDSDTDVLRKMFSKRFPKTGVYKSRDDQYGIEIEIMDEETPLSQQKQVSFFHANKNSQLAAIFTFLAQLLKGLLEYRTAAAREPACAG